MNFQLIRDETGLARVEYDVFHAGGGADHFLLEPADSLRLRNHSPTGFEWGYTGSGPAQLALSILLVLLHDEKLALELYQDFKFAVIAKLPHKRPAVINIIYGADVWLWIDTAIGEREVRRA